MSAFDSRTAASLGCALVAAASALAVAVPLAGFLAAHPTKPAGRAAWYVIAALMLAPLAVPTVLIGGIVADVTGLGPIPPAVPAGTLATWAALALTWAVGFAPLAALGIWCASRTVGLAERRAAAVMLPPWGRVRVLLAGRLRGAMALLLLALIALAMQDAATPPHLGVETSASALMSAYRTTLDPVAPVAAALPAWIILVLVFAAFGGGRRLPPESGRSDEPRAPSRATWLAATAFVAVAVVFPVAWAVNRASRTAAPIIALDRHGDALMDSMVVAAVASAFAIAGAFALVAYRGYRTGRPVRPRPVASGVVRALLAAPIVAPGLVLGLIVISVTSELDPSFDVPVFYAVVLVRALPWGILALALTAGPPRPVAAALGMSDAQRARVALVDDVALVGVAALAVVPAALREIDAHVALAPAGTDTLAGRCAQLLHYGLDADVARVMLLLVVAASVWGLALVLSIGLLRRSGAAL